MIIVCTQIHTLICFKVFYSRLNHQVCNNQHVMFSRVSKLIHQLILAYHMDHMCFVCVYVRHSVHMLSNIFLFNDDNDRDQ